MNPRVHVVGSNNSLVISRTQTKLDEGNYECQLVDSKRQSKPLKVHKFQLKLLVAPKLAPFEFAPAAQVGMKILLTCSALEGQRPISFVWLKDKQIIEAPSGGAQLDVASGAEGAKDEEDTSSPSRRLANSLGQLHQQQLAGKQLADDSEPPLDKSFDNYLLVQEDHQALERRSSASGGAGEPNSKPETVISDSAISVRQAEDYSILVIEPLELKHSGRYTCSAQNAAARVSHSSQLVINGE